jgi:hypothetical protein
MAVGPPNNTKIGDSRPIGKEGYMLNRLKEPRLADLLQDPLTAVVMARDGVSRDAIMSLLRWAAAQIAADTRGARPGRASEQ